MNEQQRGITFEEWADKRHAEMVAENRRQLGLEPEPTKPDPFENIRSKAQLKTNEEKSQYIAAKGGDAFLALPEK